jgi:hypothetical protein
VKNEFLLLRKARNPNAADAAGVVRKI